MSTTSRAVTEESLGAWLLKTSADDPSLRSWTRSDFATVTSRCVRRTYRADLVRPGQPVLLWVSGSSSVHPAGIYAVGHTTGSAGAHGTSETGSDATPIERGRPRLVMPVTLRALTPPVLRGELLRHPSLSGIEVLRMPAGSNPSFVTLDALAALRLGWPQVGRCAA